MEFSSPVEPNIVAKEQEKTRKYADLMQYFRTAYPRYKTVFIPLIIGVLGGMVSDITRNLNGMEVCRRNGPSIIQQMQKAVILGSLHVLRSFEASLGSR